MGITLLQVDAFTAEPFAGNPAAVCLLPEPRPDDWLQDVAREMNLSETAYLLREGDGFRLRWFTPVMEAELCGHATLASAHALWELGEAKPSETIKFSTCSGPASAVRLDGWIELDFPAEPAEQAEAPPELMRALGVKPLFTGKNRMDWIVEVASEEIVRGLKPDFALLATCPDRGVMVTSRSASKEFDFVSRYFGPQSGIDEDPVTGSAHCCLGPYWAPKLGKQEFRAYQASARGGVVRVRLAGKRVKLGGQAVTVLRGELL